MPWGESLKLASQVKEAEGGLSCVGDRLFPVGGVEAETGADVQT